MDEEIFQRLYGKQAFYSFLNKKKKPQRGKDKVITIPDKKEDENIINYEKRVYEETGHRLKMTGPLRMPKPNQPCPCGKVYEDGKRIKFKKCCGTYANQF